MAAIASKEADEGVVWLSAKSPIERYWRFYAIAGGHADWQSSAWYYDPATFDAAQITGRAVLVCSPGDPACRSVAGLASWREVQRILEPNGDESYYVFAQAGQ